MIKEPTVVAFFVLRTAIRQEYHRAIARRALDYKSKATAAARNNLTKTIDSWFRVDGFQHPSLAPPAKIIGALAKAISAQPEICAAVLSVWRESYGELDAAVAAAISELNDLPAEVLKFENEKIVGWSDEARAIAEQLIARLSEFEPFLVELMLACQMAHAAVGEKGREVEAYSAAATLPPPAEIAEENGGAVFSEPFAQWLSFLRNLSDSAGSWDELESFIAVARELLELRGARIEKEVRRAELLDLLNAFLERNEDELKYHGLTSLVGSSFAELREWAVAAASTETLENLLVICDRLTSPLRDYAGLREQKPISKAEKAAHREREIALEQEIEEILTVFANQISASAPRFSVNAEMPEQSLSTDQENGSKAAAEEETDFINDDSISIAEPLTDEVSIPAQIAVDDDDGSEQNPQPEQVLTGPPESTMQASEPGRVVSPENSPETDFVYQISPVVQRIPEQKHEPIAAPENTAGQAAATDSAAFSFTPEQTSAEAAKILSDDGANQNARCDLVWLLLNEEKNGLAFHLSRAQENMNLADGKRLPTRLVRTLICGRHVRLANGEIAVRLSNDFARMGVECFDDSDEDRSYGLRFLLLAAALRPALLAPTGGAASVLHNLKFGSNLAHLYEFCKAVRDFSERALPLDLGALKKVRDVISWEAEAESVRNHIKVWREQAKQFGLTYIPARQVWLTWLNNDGMFGKLFATMERDDLTPQQIAQLLEKAKSEIARLSVKSVVDEEIEAARLRLKHPGYGFEPSAVKRLNSYVEEALELVKKWIAVQDISPFRDRQKYSQGQAKELIDNLTARRAEVETEIAAFAARPPIGGGYASIGAAVLRRSLDDLWRLFDAETENLFFEPSLKYLLNADLLRLNVSLDEKWEAECSSEELEKRILETLSRPADDWSSAFEAQLERGDHEGAGRILKYLNSSADVPAHENLDLTTLADRRENHLRECLAALRRDLEETKKVINEAGGLGLLKVQEQEEFKGKLDIVEQLLPPDAKNQKIAPDNLNSRILRFGHLQNELRQWRADINNKRGVEIGRARRQLERLAPNHEIRAKIEKLLERGDAGTAWDLLERVEQKLPLLDEAEAPHGAFTRFFPETFREIWRHLHDAQFINAGGFNAVIRDLRNYGDGKRGELRLGPLDFNNVGGEIEHLIEMLETWFNLKRSERADENNVCGVLRGLGFANPKIHRKTKISPKNFRAEMSCDPLNDRNFCPTPAYGSNANGNYNVFLVFDAQTTPEEIIKNVGETVHQSALPIVFYFGRMSEERRRALARLSRERRRALVVLDEILLWFLAAEPSPRLRPFFETTLPFSFGEPYTTTAGNVPDEMFYGRGAEYNSIIDPHGACFIYGGRQLGKTALLRHVERRFHNPLEERLALFFDVKTNGICRDLNIDDIWPLLIEKFKAFGISPTKNLRPMEAFLKMLEEWVSEKPLRRVLLLLDEADEFLEVDGIGVEAADPGKQRGEFVRADRLKGLMEKTARRFKVVFAGLHNVQRTTTLANHPLAHFGTPICVGPLIERNELREAQNLIRVPLETHGYQFEEAHLATGILGQTNYYPSLIQLYCRRLLAHLNERAATPAEAKSAPPFVVRPAHLEEACNQDFRKEIRQRLIWTLQLDARYEVIGYAMIYAWLDDPERRRAEGFSVEWVRQEANYWWAEGFEDSNSEEAIRVLLDEMVGLGLLRVLENQNYTLRSVNVAFLMGTEKEIEEVLCREREKPLTYEPATFRAALRRVDGSAEPSARSPLTAQQESALQRREHGVNILYGCDAAGLNRLTDFLKNRFPENLFVHFEYLTDKNTFRERLKESVERRSEGTTLMLVAANCAWGASWLTEARRAFDALTAPNKFVQILFVAEPKTLWSLLRHEPEIFERARAAGGANVFNLRPWHDSAVRQWLDDCGFALDFRQRARVAEVTGNWSSLLERFYRAAHNDAANWQIRLEQFASRLAESDFAAEMLNEFGFDAETKEPQKVLTEMAELGGEVSEADLRELLGESVAPESLASALKWADALGLAFNRKGSWHLPSPLPRLLKTQKRAAR
jgi:hypothetical protein